MGWSIPILRVAGIQLRLHITFLLLIAWIAIDYRRQRRRLSELESEGVVRRSGQKTTDKT